MISVINNAGEQFVLSLVHTSDGLNQVVIEDKNGIIKTLATQGMLGDKSKGWHSHHGAVQGDWNTIGGVFNANGLTMIEELDYDLVGLDALRKNVLSHNAELQLDADNLKCTIIYNGGINPLYLF